MSVRFKFKNDKEFSTLNTDGFHISVKDLKKGIVRLKRLGRITDFDLLVTNSTSDRVFDNDEELISKNTTLIVARHPLEKGQKKIWYEEDKSHTLPSSANHDGDKKASDLFKESTDLTEDDRISTMMSNSSEMYDQKNWIKYKGRSAHAGQKAPANYVCKICQQTGHFPYDCPKKSMNPPIDVKRTTGIPRSFLTPATAETPGAKVNPQGKIVQTT